MVGANVVKKCSYPQVRAPAKTNPGVKMGFSLVDKINQQVQLQSKQTARKRVKTQLGRNGYGKYTNIETEMIISDAFMSLNGSAKTILMLFLLKRKGWKFKKGKAPEWVNPNQEINMTWIELESEPFNFHPEQIRRNMHTLRERGFVEVSHIGGAFKKDKNTYKLSNNWRLWSPGRNFDNKEKPLKRGFQGKGLGAVKKSQHMEM